MGPTKTIIASEEESSIDSKRVRVATSSPERKQDHEQPQQPAEVLKCPRCDSVNTKFCYYNNYSLTQPRHFCKTCRRYWTKGGALRNVPIGGGSRKYKKLKSSSSNSTFENCSTLTSPSHDLGRLKLFHGLPSNPAMDFQLGGLSLPMLNLNSSPSSGVVYSQFSNSFGDIGGPFAPLSTPNNFTLEPPLGFNFSFPSLFKQQSGNNGSFGGAGNQEVGFVGNNQEFPWKIQQQNFVDMVFGSDNNNDSQDSYLPSLENHQQILRPQSTLFQNLDVPPRTNEGFYGNNTRRDMPIGNLETEYFFEETFAPTLNPTTSTITSIGAKNGSESGSSWNNGVQAWGNLDQFDELP